MAPVLPGAGLRASMISCSARWSPTTGPTGEGWCGVLTVPDPGIPGDSMKASQVTLNLPFRFLVAIDIEGFSWRSAAEQAKLHDNLEIALSEAAASAGLDRTSWDRQPRGDGELAVLPAETNGLSLVADYPRSLASILAKINASADQGSRLRVRMSIHHGAVCRGPFGTFASGPITVCRLVDAEVLRQALRQRNDLDIALIVSTAVYDEIVQSGFRELDPRMFQRASINIKGQCFVGYLYSTNKCNSKLRLDRATTASARPRWYRRSSSHLRAITIASCGS
jgi:hypothetical protein